MNVLLIDNYDSFTHNLLQQMWGLGARVEVVRNDAVDVVGVRRRAPSHVVLSPGPGRPERPYDFGVCSDIIDQMTDTPILGVCLGHQGIGWRMGGQVVRAPAVVHGKVDEITHTGEGLFAGLPQPLPVMRYHSLMLARAGLPDTLRVTAENAEGLVMAVAHRDRPLFGLQFHPESIGTPDGDGVLSNFLQVA
ncbi:MAG: aminodeoxychorismate/anthranilate synthase component II [Myxococcota bacterium]